MNKILIITHQFDESTTKVMEWIKYYDDSVDVIRLNAEEFFSNYSISMTSIGESIKFRKNKIENLTSQIKLVWIRKWFFINDFNDSDFDVDYKSFNIINENIKNEKRILFNYFLYCIKKNNCFWINKESLNEFNKLIQLENAINVGLKTPNTILSTNKKDIIGRKNLICKAMSNSIAIHQNEKSFFSFTDRVKSFPTNHFFVSMFQKEIQKEFEIRTFYLDRKCYSIRIYSQSSDKTTVDYRNYDFENPNRIEFHVLPSKIEEKIIKLMEIYNLKTASIDFILDKKGDYYFLEINPSGQFGIFEVCNINPHQLIAEYIIKNFEAYK